MAQAQFWLNEGTVVGGRYTLEKVLGKGGYGITYKAMDERLRIPVAVKEYFPLFWCSRFIDNGPKVAVNQGMEADFCKGMDRVYDEGRTLAQLKKIPEVVQVTDLFEENGTVYLVMEYLEGKTLKQMVEGFGGRIPADVLIPVLSPLLFALKAIHERGMIHRDLSPDNIMMLEDGSVCLIDFGNARDTNDDKSMTLAMKEGFAPPEQYRSRGQGPYTDVYGLCATLYYCLTGKLPPYHMDRLGGAELPTPSSLGVQLPKHQEDAILKGLDLFVKNRIQNMEELWQALYAQPQEDKEGIPSMIDDPNGVSIWDIGLSDRSPEVSNSFDILPSYSVQQAEKIQETVPAVKDAPQKLDEIPIHDVADMDVLISAVDVPIYDVDDPVISGDKFFPGKFDSNPVPSHTVEVNRNDSAPQWQDFVYRSESFPGNGGTVIDPYAAPKPMYSSVISADKIQRLKKVCAGIYQLIKEM